MKAEQVPYSTFPCPAWRAFKATGREHTEYEYACFSDSILRTVHERLRKRNGDFHLDLLSMGYMHVELLAGFLWRFRPLRHFFLEPDVADFCVGSVRELSEEYSARLPECPMVKFPIETGMVQGGFCVHFPAKERQRSLIVIPNLRFWLSEKADAGYYAGGTDGVDNFLAQRDRDMNDWDTKETTSLWLVKLVFGLSLYMDAFPETVLPAEDNEIHRIKFYRGTTRRVTTNQYAEEDKRCSISPHWRRGHFRLLSSPAFVRKQGQTVYVRGTFVKGHAFDVLADAQPVLV